MKRGTPRHPKVGKLCEELGISVPTAVGILELLWHFTAEFAPQGDIGKFDDSRIEAAMLSPFRPKGKLILALIKTGWIDQDEVSRLIVHDWCDHADASVRKRLERSHVWFVAVTPKVTGRCTATLPDGGIPPDPILSRSNPSPEPEPSHSQIDTPSLRAKPARSLGGQSVRPPSTELRETLSLWKRAFPRGPISEELERIRAELTGCPEKVFCAHLDAMKACFQPGGAQEPEKPGFFVSVARNFAKEYAAASKAIDGTATEIATAVMGGLK